MTPKRLFVFLLLVLSAPLWLTLRNQFGRYSLVTIVAAYRVGYLALYVFIQLPDFPLMPTFVQGLAKHYYSVWEFTLFPLAAQGISLLWDLFLMMIRERRAARPWYFGKSFLSLYHDPSLFDVLLLAFLALGANTMLHIELPNADNIQLAITLAPFIAYLIVRFMSYRSGYDLPMRPPLEPTSPARSPDRSIIARLRTKAAPNSETLSEIFSRRDASLRQIANPAQRGSE